MEKNSNIIDLRRFWRAVKRLKWLYLAAIIVCGGAATWYVTRSLKKFPIKGEILIGEESMDSATGAAALAGAGKSAAGGMGQLMKTFSVGGFGGAAVDNEALILGSHDVLLRTVKNLNLNRTYIGKDEDGKKKLLYRNSPVTVDAPAEFFDTLHTSFDVKIKLLPGGKADIKVQKGLLRHTLAEISDVKLPTAVKTPYGTLQIMRTDTFDSSPYRNVSVRVAGNELATMSLSKQLDIDLATKLSDVLEVTIEYADVQLGKDIVDGVMGEYNAKRLERTHETALNTIKYYDERIAETLKQLEQAEQKVADYQRQNSVIAPEPELKLLSEMTQEQRLQVLEAQNKLDYYTKVTSTLRNNLNGDILIPQIEALGDSNVVKYNELVLERRDLSRSATDNNPLIIKLNERIATMRNLILDNAEKFAAKARNDIAFQNSIVGSALSRMKSYPGLELDLSVLARDQTFQRALYQFLVQARENAVLKYYTETDAGFVFQPAYECEAKFPIRKLVLVIAATVFGIVCVTCLALILLWCSRRVKAPMDVAFIGIDGNTLEYTDGNAEVMARLRTKLTADAERRVIYCADLTDGKDITGRLEQSFATAWNVARLTESTTDRLLSAEFAGRVDKAVAENDYVIVDIPACAETFMLENVIDKPEAELFVAIPAGMKRMDLKQTLKGQTASKVFAVIVNA